MLEANCCLLFGNVENMSKVGQNPITVVSGATVELQDKIVKVTGPKGTLIVELPHVITAKLDNGKVIMERKNDTKQTKSLHGTFRSLINNAVLGVTTGWEKRLEVTGTGFGVVVKNGEAVFKVGYSHPVVFKKVDGVTYSADGTTILIISGSDRQLVGQVAHLARLIKKPDPYKGKGVRYVGEVIKLKVGKKTKAA